MEINLEFVLANVLWVLILLNKHSLVNIAQTTVNYAMLKIRASNVKLVLY